MNCRICNKPEPTSYEAAPVFAEPGLCLACSPFQPLKLTAEEEAWIAQYERTAKDIMLAFAVPPDLIGETVNHTSVDLEAARESLFISMINSQKRGKHE